ncbi:MAG TPA: M56 family metallopeptidase [Candidatus Saccharimonadales bacterium]|nr:M56 family metallopeptidase [Candidatus Saccharimonadales bacterium]
MNPTLAAFFGWLLRASWQTSVLVLVLTVQWIFRRHLGAQWRYALWLLVLRRLVLPSMPSSPMSLCNYARLDTPRMRSMPTAPARKALPASASPFALHKTPSTTYEEAVVLRQPAASATVRTEMTIGKTAPAMAIQARAASTPGWRDELPNFCALAWLGGAILAACRVLVQNVLFLGLCGRRAKPKGSKIQQRRQVPPFVGGGRRGPGNVQPAL